MKIAIVTGASSGLGRVFANHIIEKEDVDEYWLIARREDRLNEIKAKYPSKKIVPVPLDLSKDESYIRLETLLREKDADVRILVNNAGYLKPGSFEETDLLSVLNMINLNVKGVTGVNKACLPYLNKGSYVILVSSVSSFAPMPYQAVYGPTKSYIFKHGYSLALEWKKKGINVLTLCPGNMNTEMNVAGRKTTGDNNINSLPYLNLDKMVNKSIKKARKGKRIYIPGHFYRAYYRAVKFLPIHWVAKMVEHFTGED